jgi:hypothetical protein
MIQILLGSRSDKSVRCQLDFYDTDLPMSSTVYLIHISTLRSEKSKQEMVKANQMLEELSYNP